MPEVEDTNTSIGVWAVRGLPAMPLRMRVLVISVCTMCLVALTLSVVVKIPEIRKLRGQIIAKGSVANIDAPSRGIISNVYIETGQFIERDDPVFRIDASIARFAAGDTLESDLAQLDLQLAKAQDELQQNAVQQADSQRHHLTQISLLNDQVRIQEELVIWLREDIEVYTAQMERATNLKDSGIATRNTQEQAQLQLNASQQHLLNAQAQVVLYKQKITDTEDSFQRMNAQLVREASRLASDIEQLQIKIADEKKNDIVTVLAPISGWVTKVLVNEGESVGTTPKNLVQISANRVQSDGFEMEFYSSSSELDGLTIGQSARVAMDTFDVNSWGTAELELTEISQSAYNSQELDFAGNSAEPVFVLKAKLIDSEFLQGKASSELRVGMTGTGYFIASERRLISWVIEPVAKVIHIIFRLQTNWSDQAAEGESQQ